MRVVSVVMSDVCGRERVVVVGEEEKGMNWGTKAEKACEKGKGRCRHSTAGSVTRSNHGCMTAIYSYVTHTTYFITVVRAGRISGQRDPYRPSSLLILLVVCCFWLWRN